MSGSDLGRLCRSCGTVVKSCNDGPQDLDLACRRGVDSVGNQKAVAGHRAASFTPGPPLRQSPSWALGELEDITCPLGDGKVNEFPCGQANGGAVGRGERSEHLLCPLHFVGIRIEDAVDGGQLGGMDSRLTEETEGATHARFPAQSLLVVNLRVDAVDWRTDPGSA
jgi:hypothetical protein